MKIDKEGYKIIRNALIIFAILAIVSCYTLPCGWAIGISSLLLLVWLFVVRFFRIPHRELRYDENLIYAPCDGTVVVVEKTYEDEYLKEECMQVSIFMSVNNVHANWYPMAGVVKYFRHHQGKFLLAWHPKSSTENERTTTVVEGKNCTLLFRQIAGLVARRIVSYAKEGSLVEQNQRCGFIKFGSRVDLFLPLDAQINVKIDDKTVGTQTIIATLKNSN